MVKTRSRRSISGVRPSHRRTSWPIGHSLMTHCVTQGLIASDPTQGVKSASIKTSGYRTWTEGDIAAFEAKHPIGSRARLALALLTYTAQRRSDIVGLGRQHIRDGVLQM